MRLPLLLLALVITISFSYSIYEVSMEKGAILMQLEELARDAALPFRVAELSLRPRNETVLVPVDGVRVRQIADTWGDARSEGRTHEGTDIFADRGTAVYAATEGYVVRVGDSELGGIYVFVLGSGGVRYYYAHLDRVALGIELGTKVTTDTVLGFVGNTGNAATTDPHLHFGVYYRGAENPYPLLINRD